MTILTKLYSLLTTAIELPNALHACVEMAREADYSRHEMDRLPSELNEELLNKHNELELWRSWARNMSTLDDGEPDWRLREDIRIGLCQVNTQVARIVELEKELGLAKDENRALDLRQKIANKELDRFIAWASPLAQSLPGTVCGDYVSDTIRDHVERITRELAELKCNLSDMAERYSRAAEMAAASERDLNREREARRRRKQSEEPAPKKEVVLELTSNGNGHPNLCLGMYVTQNSEWRYLSPEDMPND